MSLWGSKEELQAWRDRWRLVNEREAEEIVSTPIEVKLEQLLSLMAMSRALGWDEALRQQAQEEVVRERWLRLKKHYGV